MSVGSLIHDDESRKENLSGGKIHFDIDEELLKVSIIIQSREFTYDFKELLSLNGVDIDSITTSTIDSYLGQISAMRFTLDGLINRVEMEINRLDYSFEIWIASAREAAKKSILQESLAMVEEGKVAKSFVSEPSKDKTTDRLISLDTEGKYKLKNELDKLRTSKKFLESLLYSIQQASICLMNITNRRNLTR